MTTEPLDLAATIAKRLHIKADVISMGKRVQWGSEIALMHEAADFINEQQAYIDKLVKALERSRNAWYMTGTYENMSQFELEPVVKVIDNALDYVRERKVGAK